MINLRIFLCRKYIASSLLDVGVGQFLVTEMKEVNNPSCLLLTMVYLGSIPQISLAYSAMVLSELNLPLLAMLWMAISAHLAWSM